MDASYQKPLPRIPEQYEIISLLGEGGMGVVYKARNVFTGGFVAIKVIRSDKVSDILLQRFQREAKAATALNHPNAVKVMDFGLLDGNPYLVMEYVKGESLEEHLKRSGPLAEIEALQLFSDITAALARAHSIGVVHRDLKPENILLQQGESGSTAKIMDFGIARFVDASAPKTLTQTGEVFGTPLYMSPEQLKGSDVDARSDVYSLGAVMYRCLTGALPHQGETVYEIMFKRLSETPATFAQLGRPDIPAGLERVVFKCLELDAADRYKNASDLAVDLERYTSSRQLGKALLPGLEKTGDASRKLARRHKRAVVYWLVGASALITASIIFVPGLKQQYETHAASTALQKLVSQADHEFALREFRAAQPRYSDILEVLDLDPTLLPKGVRILCYDHAIESAQHNNDLFSLVRFLNARILLPDDNLEAYLHFKSLRSTTISVLEARAADAYSKRDFQNAWNCYNAAWSVLAAKPDFEIRNNLMVEVCDLVDTELNLKKYNEALDHAQTGLEYVTEQVKGEEPAKNKQFQYYRIAELHLQMAVVYGQLGHNDEQDEKRVNAYHGAMKAVESGVLAMSPRATTQPYMLQTSQTLAELLTSKGKCKEAESVLKKEFEFLKFYPAPDHVLFQATAIKDLGDAAFTCKQIGAAKNYYKQAWSLITGTSLMKSQTGLLIAAEIFSGLAKIAPDQAQTLRHEYEKCQAKYGFSQPLPSTP